MDLYIINEIVVGDDSISSKWNFKKKQVIQNLIYLELDKNIL